MDENVMNGTETVKLEDVVDTDNMSGGTLAFVQDNAAGLAVIGLAIVGGYQLVKGTVKFIRSKLPAKTEKKETLKDRLKKKVKKEGSKEES